MGVSSASAGVGQGTWTGFYAGVHGGVAAASAPATFEDGTAWNGLGFFGGEVGAFVGVNQQVGTNGVVGIEADGSWLGLGNIEYDGTHNASVDRTASIDGRLGYLVSPSTLLYGKLGWAAIDFDVPTASYLYPGAGARWLNAIQAGVGMETDVGGGWRARVETVYTRALQTYFSSDGQYSIDVRPDVLSARVGLGYAFGDRSRPVDATPAANWSGLYFGGAAGWATSDTREIYGTGPYDGTSWDGFGGSGADVGGFVGVNQQLGSSIVVGIEFDAALLNLVNKEGYIPTLEWGTTHWMASIDGRAGVLINPKTLLYAKAGAAWLGFSSNYGEYGLSGTTDSPVLGAVQFGVGMEQQMSSHWTARIEALYTAAPTGYEFADSAPYQDHFFKPQIVSGSLGVAYRY